MSEIAKNFLKYYYNKTDKKATLPHPFANFARKSRANQIDTTHKPNN